MALSAVSSLRTGLRGSVRIFADMHLASSTRNYLHSAPRLAHIEGLATLRPGHVSPQCMQRIVSCLGHPTSSWQFRSVPITDRRSLSSSSIQGTAPEVEVDEVVGMPRYPDATPMGILRGLDYFGTIVFASTGSITAACAGMDVFGSMILGAITAVGGGTIRDVVVLGKRPFWSDGESEYFTMSLVAAAAAFFLWPTLQEIGYSENDLSIFVADAIGVGAFCVIGAKNGVRAGMHPLICVACGIMTATFGGVVRDTLAKRPVRIFHSHSEIYATTAGGGAAAYLVARKLRLPLWARISVGFGVAFGMRTLAWGQGVRLPTWESKGQGKWQVRYHK